jgi:hypothetical protein
MNASFNELEIVGIIDALRKNNPHITVEGIVAATRAGLKSRGIKWNAALEFKVRYCADKYPNLGAYAQENPTPPIHAVFASVIQSAPHHPASN